MKRRTFVKSSIISGSLGGVTSVAGHIMATGSTNKDTSRQYYELRTYTLKDKAQQQLVEAYWKDAAIPALGRLGSGPVGVFTEASPQGQSKIFVLIPFASAQGYIDVQEKLMRDQAYLRVADGYLNAPAASPAYERIESSLLHAFAHMPVIEKPATKAGLFELRRYESASEGAGAKKIEMFNTAGEIDIFKRVGLSPVFFGEALIGANRPNLTYMLHFESMEDHNQKWKNFGGDPEWKKISSKPEYADALIVSRITSTFLLSSDYSQIG